MALVMALIVGSVRRVQVQMSLQALVLVAIVFLLVVLEVPVQHAMVRILLVLPNACDIVRRVRILVDIVLDAVLLLDHDAMLGSQVSDLLRRQLLPLSLLLRLLRGGLRS